jgi:hypothetical protein
VKRVGKPESFEYATDNQTATIADAIPVQVRATIKGKKGDPQPPPRARQRSADVLHRLR